jgi:hypothetical protein
MSTRFLASVQSDGPSRRELDQLELVAAHLGRRLATKCTVTPSGTLDDRTIPLMPRPARMDASPACGRLGLR